MTQLIIHTEAGVRETIPLYKRIHLFPTMRVDGMAPKMIYFTFQGLTQKPILKINNVSIAKVVRSNIPKMDITNLSQETMSILKLFYQSSLEAYGKSLGMVYDDPRIPSLSAYEHPKEDTIRVVLKPKWYRSYVKNVELKNSEEVLNLMEVEKTADIEIHLTALRLWEKNGMNTIIFQPLVRKVSLN
jgi:hypothetical protein